MRMMSRIFVAIALSGLSVEVIRLRTSLRHAEDDRTRTHQVSTRLIKTNDSLLSAIESCRATSLELADSSRELTLFKMSKEAEGIRRRYAASPYFYVTRKDGHAAAVKAGLGGP